MIISSIKKRRNDVEILFNDNSKIFIDYRIVFDNGLRKYDDITKEYCEDLILQSEKLKLKDSAFRLLGRRQHSVHELKQKLLLREFAKALIDLVTQQLKEDGYLNDQRFAEAYTAERISKRRVGQNKIKAELIKKGIDKKIIENVLSNVDMANSEETAFFLLKKKFDSIKMKEADSRKIRQKLSSFLFTKGFEPELIKKVIGKLDLKDDVFEDL